MDGWALNKNVCAQSFGDGPASSAAHHDAHLLPKPKLAFAVEYGLQGYPAHPVRQKNQQMLWPALNRAQARCTQNTASTMVAGRDQGGC